MGGGGRSRPFIGTVVSALYCRGCLFPASDAYQAGASSAPKQFKCHVSAQLLELQALATRDVQRVDSPRSGDLVSWFVKLHRKSEFSLAQLHQTTNHSSYHSQTSANLQ